MFFPDNINMWPLGQAVKTPDFHSGNMGSIPVGVICEQLTIKIVSCFVLRDSKILSVRN